MNDDLIKTKEFFASNGIKLSDFWLENCINWCRQEIGSRQYTSEELYSKVHEQWLLLDLRDVELPQLPTNAAKAKKMILNKTLFLQLMSVLDISKSKFTQLQTLKNLNPLTRGIDDDSNEEDKPGAKRMLQLTLTDGVEEIKAIEYRTIPELNINLTPGAKIKLIHPITIRRGRIMLEPHNIKLHGGEVEELLISNAAENVLLRGLGLPENPEPAIIDENFYTKLNNSNYINRDMNNRNIIENIKNSDQSRPREIANQNIQGNNTSLTRNLERNQGIIPEDEFGLDDEIDMLLETERDILNENNLRTLTESSIKEIISCKTKTNSQLDCNLDLEDDLFNSFEIDKQLDEIEENYHILHKASLKIVLENIGKNKYGKYKVHAKFKSVTEKLTVKDDKWILQISITDGPNDLPIYIHNDILTEMTGFTAQHMTNIKQKIQNETDNAVQSVMKVKLKSILFMIY